MKILKRLLFLAFVAILLSLVLIYWSNRQVKQSSESYIFTKDSLAVMPEFKCGLVLGTSEKLGDGSDNPFFLARIEAAVALYKSGKIEKLILSGDNSRVGYDEPEMMKQALIRRAIPDSVIYLDYAGFRTFDSVIRCAEIFGQKRFLIISQHFHNERALYLARNNGLDAYAYDAEDVAGQLGENIKYREYLARANAWLDLNILGTSARFLGERIEIK